MTRDEIHVATVRILTKIAPEVDPATLKSDVILRDQLDIDSMDFLNFVIGLHNEFHIDIPEADYAKLSTLDGCVDFLLAAKAGKP